MRRLILALALLATPAPAQLRIDRRADLALPVVPGPKQSAILAGSRRPDPMSAGESGAAALARYGVAKREVTCLPEDAKKSGDATYRAVARSDRKPAADDALLVVSEGDYVLSGATPGPGGQMLDTFCLGAPTFHVTAGEVACSGDFTPYMAVMDLRRARRPVSS